MPLKNIGSVLSPRGKTEAQWILLTTTISPLSVPPSDCQCERKGKIKGRNKKEIRVNIEEKGKRKSKRRFSTLSIVKYLPKSDWQSVDDISVS